MEEAKMARKALIWSMVMGLALSFIANHVYGDHSLVGQFSGSHYHDQIRKMQDFKDSFTQPSTAPSPSYTQQPQVQTLYVSLNLLSNFGSSCFTHIVYSSIFKSYIYIYLHLIITVTYINSWLSNIS